MKIKNGLAALALGVAIGVPLTGGAEAKNACDNRSNNNHAKLLECVTIDGVRRHQAAWQAIADANGGIRTSGTAGYDESAQYVFDQLAAAGYNPVFQPFQFNTSIRLSDGALAQIAPVASSYVFRVDYDYFSQTDAGDVTAPVEAVDLDLGLGNTSTSGCEPADFAGFTPGSIALMQRGLCSFQLKAENAAAAGAVGAIIFNQGNTELRRGLIGGTLGNTYSGGIPVVEMTYALGEELANTPGLVLRLWVDVFRGEATTVNVIAETAGGNPDNVVMVGAHLDSVDEGPGIQDNGTGSAAVLEVALQMAKVKPVNKVRFAWWGAEEAGLVGSRFYVADLTDEEAEDITLYLNFDMIGSPNHFFGVYDGDGSGGFPGGAGPEGSAQIEKTFEDYYGALGVPSEPTDFSGRSDYGPFIAIGIPAGGLFTGAEGIKTPAQVALYGGTAGDQYDPCYHQACDTFDNINLEAFAVNSDAVAYSTLKYAMSTGSIDGSKGKGNFSERKLQMDAEMAKFEMLGSHYQQ